ncbi:MAG: hypothetical protein ACHP9Z_09715 [Streptosporangiales bacterium]
MDAELQIGNDPAVWFFDPARCDEVAAGLAPPGAPWWSRSSRHWRAGWY